MSAVLKLWNFLRSLPATGEWSERHRPSGTDDSFYYHAASIDEYLDAARQRVATARTDLDGVRDNWIIDGNSPFALAPAQPNGRAVLMTHGLTDAPFAMRDIAQFFCNRGFHVLAIQLPGHGTRPGDLLGFRWQDWLRAQRHALRLLKAQAEDVYLLGFSAGATLSLHQAILDPAVKGLFLFSPAIRVSPLARITFLLRALGRYSRRFAWFDVLPDTDYFKYESLTNHAIAEVFSMIQAMHRLSGLAERRLPLFVAASEQDSTLDSTATLDWFAQQIGPRRMLYYTRGKPAVPDFVERVDARLPDRRISSFAHTAMLHAPDNPHYGEGGSQHVCTHYYNFDPEKYRRCMAGDEDCLGEMFHESADCEVVRRLTFNPYYEELLAELGDFIDRVCGN